MTIKPCPFCGGKRPMVVRYPADELGPGAFAVRCARLRCVAQGPAESTSDAAVSHAGLAGWRQWAAWESGERRPPAATWELWLLRMRMHPHYELLPRRGYSPASGPAQARTT